MAELLFISNYKGPDRSAFAENYRLVNRRGGSSCGNHFGCCKIA